MVGSLILLMALSPLEAAVRSLILPGWGQASLGRSPRGFFVVEGVLGLTTFWGIRQSQRYDVQARMLALRQARPEGTLSDAFFDLAEGYETWEDYRDELFLQARELYPEDPEAQHRYVENRLPPFTWAWPDRETWYRYGDLRGFSRSWGNRSRVLMGLWLTHHVVSALNAYFLARDSRMGITFHPTPEGGTLRLTWSF